MATMHCNGDDGDESPIPNPKTFRGVRLWVEDLKCIIVRQVVTSRGVNTNLPRLSLHKPEHPHNLLFYYSLL